MKKFKNDLISISKSVSKIAEKLEKIAEMVEKESVPINKLTKKAAGKKKATPKVAKKRAAPKKDEAKKTAQDAADSTDDSESESLLDRVYELVKRNRGGITVAEIKDKTGLASRQVSNTLYKLTKKGKIETVTRGTYVEKNE